MCLGAVCGESPARGYLREFLGQLCAEPVNRLAGLLIVGLRQAEVGFRPLKRPPRLGVLTPDDQGAGEQTQEGDRREAGRPFHEPLVAPDPLPRQLDERVRPGDRRQAVQKPLQVIRQGRSTGVTLLAGFRDGFLDDGFQVGGQVPAECPGSQRFVLLDLPQQVRAVVTTNRRAQSQQLIERDAKRIDVGAMIDFQRTARGLLGTHVTHGAQQVSGAREVGIRLAAR